MARPTKAQKAFRAPIANENAGPMRRRLAPYPQVDRYPFILGSNITVAYCAAVLRLAQQGYRQQLVDALTELIEKDPHAFAVVAQRVLAVAGGRVELVPAPVTDPESKDAKRAREIRDDLQRRIDAIPQFTQAVYTLAWSGIYYGAGCVEVIYDAPREDGWWVAELQFVHSRRLAAPDQNAFDPHIWDQGAVSMYGNESFPTAGIMGLRIADWPGKFVFHAPKLHGQYWLGEGLGRMIIFWLGIKMLAVRGAGQYVERFSKPWALGQYVTEEQSTGKPRAALDPDIAILNDALAALGTGSLASAVLPDCVKISLDGPGIKGNSGGIDHEKLIALCDAQVSKAVRGGTLTTDAGKAGARSLGEVHEEGDVRNARYDAACLADSIDAGLIKPLCRMNHPGEEHLCPTTTIHVEKISPTELLERALKLAASGAPVDGKALADRMGVKLIDPKDPNPVRLAPLKPTDLFALVPTASGDLPTAIEALAALVGVSLTPSAKSQIAEMDHDEAARLVQDLIGAAAEDQKDETEASNAMERADGAIEPSEVDGDSKAAKPTKPGKGAKPVPAKTPPRARGAKTKPATADTPEE